MNLKKYQGQARKDRGLKKPMEKRPLRRQEKKLKRPCSLKRHPKPLNLLIQARKKKGRFKMIKRKKYPFAGCERRIPKIF